MAAVNSVATTRLPLPTFSPRAVLMYSAAVGGEGAVALQLREANPGELADDRLAIACHEPELLDLLHAAADIGHEHDSLSALLGASSPDVALASDTSDSLPLPDIDHGSPSTSSTPGPSRPAPALTAPGPEARPPVAAKKVRPKPASPNRQGPQQCQTCNKVFGNASALAKHKLTHSDERKYVCNMCAKAFKRQDHLNGHLLTHRNKKPYECKADGCGKSYCDARSLRRHTENHHQPARDDHPTSSASTAASSAATALSVIARTSDYAAARVARGVSPASPPRNKSPLSESSNSGSEKSSSPSSDSSPPTPPAAPAHPGGKPKPKPRTKTFTITLQPGQRCGTSTSGASSGAGSVPGSAGTSSVNRPPSENKPVECNLCHRKFKNIPALNGHMRLHGGYFKKDSDSKKLDKKETTGPPLQTASVSVRALIEEKIISRRATSVASTPGTSADPSSSRAAFVAPAPPPLSSTRTSLASPASPAAGSTATAQFVSPRAPPVLTVTANIPAGHRDSTLIELLKKGNTKLVKRSASDPGQTSPQQDFFRPELFGVSFHSDDGYFSPALNDDAFQFSTTPDQLEDLASLEDYATVAASIRDRSPGTFPSNRRLAAVLNSPLPESLADFGACHGGSPVPSPGIGYTANSPGLSYSTGDSPGMAYTASSPGGPYSSHATPSPGMGYPTPPASHDAQLHSPVNPVPRASSPLSAAFFTATMSSQEEVEEALEEVLPEECGSLDAFTLDPSPTVRRIMLNAEDPLLSSSPRDFGHQRPLRRQNRVASQVWQSSDAQDGSSLQVCVEGRDTIPAVFLSPSSVPASPRRRKRRASPAGPFRTRMRRSISHYVPEPILPPDREGTGLYVELTAGLPTEADSTSQVDQPPPRINIGPDHQADIPELSSDRIDLHRATEQLLWDPGINDQLHDNEVRMFMELAMCAAMPVGGHTREYALQTLGECGGDIKAATLRLMSHAQGGADQRWTPEEVETFLAGLRHYDKDFYRIAQLIRTKDSKQCIQFYYFWKKVTRDYKSYFLRSWSLDPDGTAQGTSKPHASCSSSPAPYEGEEYPCKICGKVFNKVKSRSAHMKSHRPLDAEPKRHKLEKPFEKVERSDDRSHSL